jgi:hypothetical protein
MLISKYNFLPELKVKQIQVFPLNIPNSSIKPVNFNCFKIELHHYL